MELGRDTIELLMNKGAAGVKPVEVYSDSTRIIVGIPGTGGNLELVEYQKERPTRNHQFATLVGLIEYLNSKHCVEDDGILFVSRRQIRAELKYRTTDRSLCNLTLEHTSEYNAFQRLVRPEGHTQRDLWRLLITDLDGCVSKALLLAISQIKIKATEEANITIDSTGLANSDSRGSATVLFNDPSGKGQHTANIPLDWDWTGQLWTCFEEQSEIGLRLELANDNGLKFHFHPIRIERVVETTHQRMVENIREQLPPQFTVYEGIL